MFVPFSSVIAGGKGYKTAVVMILVVPIVIEMMQLFLNIGMCEFDDVISNAIGGLLGISITYLLGLCEKKNALVASA